jgi:DNA-binding CsgD family transcriptional regulator
VGFDSDTLLDLIGEVQGLLDLDELRQGMLGALGRAVPSDWISLNDVGPGPADVEVLIEPAFPDDAFALFARLAHQNPLIERHRLTQDGRAYRFSDVVTRDELHALEIYREFYGPLGVEHQIAFTLPGGPDRLLGVALSRGGRDYDDDERDLLNRARPFLIQAYRNAIEHSVLAARLGDPRRSAALDDRILAALRDSGLTPREAEVLAGAAAGATNKDIAESCGIGVRTVEAHLARGYRKLGVHRRAEAAALAWSLRGS